MPFLAMIISKFGPYTFESRNNFLNCNKLCNIFTGVILNNDDEEAEIAFKHAVLRENMYNAFELVPIIKKIEQTDSFEAEKTGDIWFEKCESTIEIHSRVIRFYF